ncbi:hypothetical protein ZYGR_0S01410 [Zygosaccharomyces rouxii]|uniref:ZYRO0F05632p n=2 Tax=Zygosaccharomyces rouxii TaxID=4956 RepID=C5DXJ7_ZYGRC|nr:uncharacterized protein ZYRO0F05632g [Zygosaccharomyces rouxii]KAH9199270.1 Oxo-4-hydroxy-4-carboxy-5-ureidoimidazoline decarboxylase [Zygosaccharomyces rouxii]GAV50007.1 hypothetical protein ZYGR_0S01410 [Zygosaccharomyces rouxii]CAR28508.1 ZYRO0F05632p [Zygosaccharomyces rouxii]
MMQYQNFVHASKDHQLVVMNELFEPCQGLIRLTVDDDGFMPRARELDNYKEFIELVRSTLIQVCLEVEMEASSSSSSTGNRRKLLEDVVNAHPRLGETKKQLSTHSMLEQKNLQSSQDSPEIQKKLLELNHEYEKVYPGLRFVVFVNGRTRLEIIRIMESRITSGNDWFKEVRTAMQELCNIAQDRYRKNSSRL